MEALVAAGADVDVGDDKELTPLGEAASKGHDEVIHVLVGAGAKVNRANEDGDAALYWAADTGHVKAIDALVGAGAEVRDRLPSVWTVSHQLDLSIVV